MSRIAQIRIRKRGCTNLQRLSQTSFLTMVQDTTRAYFESIDPNDWEIRSFDTITREVCITLHTPSGDRLISYTVAPIV